MKSAVSPSGFSTLHIRLAGQIVEFAQLRGMEAGAHLSAEPLAKIFGVSRSPVAKALTLLCEIGAVQQVNNRGHFVNDLSRYDAQELHSEEDRLYWRMVNDLLDQALPDSMDEAEVMRRYSVPRSQTVRVFRRMAEEGIVKRKPGVGWTFQMLLRSVEERRASLRFRLTTELSSFDEPTFDAPSDALNAIRAEQQTLYDEADRPGMSIINFERNTRFHEAIAQWSGNPFLTDAVRQHSRLRRVTEYRGFVKPARLRISSEEHLLVLDAIASGDLKLAQQRLRDHLLNTPITRIPQGNKPADII